jgi:hypothetical protein
MLRGRSRSTWIQASNPPLATRSDTALGAELAVPVNPIGCRLGALIGVPLYKTALRR